MIKKFILYFIVLSILFMSCTCTATVLGSSAGESYVSVTLTGRMMGLATNNTHVTVILESDGQNIDYINMFSADLDGDINFSFDIYPNNNERTVKIICGNVEYAASIVINADTVVDVTPMRRLSVSDGYLLMESVAEKYSYVYLLNDCAEDGTHAQANVIASALLNGEIINPEFSLDEYSGDEFIAKLCCDNGYYIIRNMNQTENISQWYSDKYEENDGFIRIYGTFPGLNNENDAHVYMNIYNADAPQTVLHNDGYIDYLFKPDYNDDNNKIFVKSEDVLFFKNIGYDTKYVNTSIIRSIITGNGAVTVSGDLAGSDLLSYDEASDVYKIAIPDVKVKLMSSISDDGTYGEILTDTTVPIDSTFSYRAELNVSEAVVNSVLVVEVGEATIAIKNINPNVITEANFDVPYTRTNARFAEDVGDPESIKVLRSEMPVKRLKSSIGDDTVKYYVAVDGDDKNQGTIDNPFATLQKAFDVVSKLSDRTKAQGVEIFLREGQYDVSSSSVLSDYKTTAEAPLYISNHNGENVVFNGGENLSYADFHAAGTDFTDNIIDTYAREHIMEYDLSNWDLSTLNPELMQLHVNGERQTVARYPNYNRIDFQNVLDVSNDIRGFVFSSPDARVGMWSKPSEVYMYGGYVYHFWPKSTRIESVVSLSDSELNSLHNISTCPWCKDSDFCQYAITVEQESGDAVNTNSHRKNDYYYYNIPEELDIPGEWYVDKVAKKLYIYPTADFDENSEIIFYSGANNTPVVTLSRCSNVILNGINFTNVRGGVCLRASDNCTVQNCTVNAATGYGISLEGGCTDCDIIYNTVSDVGSYAYNASYGIQLKNDEKHPYSYTRTSNYIQNNIISESVLTCTGMLVRNQIGSVVSHNLFTSSINSTLKLEYGFENYIEYNEFSSCSEGISDSGVIYTQKFAVNLQNHIRSNYIRQNPLMNAAVHAIYLDELASQQYVYNNIVEDVSGALFSNCGNSNAYVGNIIKISEEMSDYYSATQTNIVPIADYDHYFKNGSSWMSCVYDDSSDPGYNAYLKIYINDDYAYRYPETLAYIREISRVDDLTTEVAKDLRRPFDQYYAFNSTYGCVGYTNTDTGEWVDEDMLFLKAVGKGTIENDNVINSLSDYYNSENVRYIKEKAGLTDKSRSYADELVINGVLSDGTFGVVSWNDVAFAEYFTVEISESADMSDAMIYKTFDTHCRFEELSGEYYIRVTAVNDANSIGYNSICTDTYTVDAVPAVSVIDENISSDGKLTFKVQNNTDTEQQFTLIVAECNLDGKFLQCKELKKKVVVEGNGIKAYEVTNIVEGAKIYLWKGLDSLTPFGKSVFVKVPNGVQQ